MHHFCVCACFFKTHLLVYYHFFFPLKWAHSRECICLRDFSFFFIVCVWAVVLRVSYTATHVRIFFGTYEKLARCLYRCTTHLKSYFYEHSGHIEYFVFFSRSPFFVDIYERVSFGHTFHFYNFLFVKWWSWVDDSMTLCNIVTF